VASCRSRLRRYNRPVAHATKPRFVDTSNPALAIECPRCGLLTPRFLPYCKNCSFALWPSRAYAGAAFHAWQAADPRRAAARPYDMEIPAPAGPEVVDYEERAHRLGIHIFPSSNFPFVICVGFLFLGLAAIPFPGAARLVLLVIGLAIFLIGVVGWVVLEDVRMYPTEDEIGHEESGH
jgi:hypothetical protein